MAGVKTTTIHIHESDNVAGICGETRTVPEEGFLEMCEKCRDIYAKRENNLRRQTDAPAS